MSGTNIQLNSFGEQDEEMMTIELDGRFFFMSSWEKFTNFATQYYNQNFQNSVSFGNESTLEIQRFADFVNKAYIILKLNPLKFNYNTDNSNVSETDREQFKACFVRELGTSMIDYVEFLVGSIQIEKQHGIYMSTWHELTRNLNKENGYKQMIGDVDDLTMLRPLDSNSNFTNEYKLYIPLMLWFTNYKKSLPLVSLRSNECQLKLKLKQFRDCVITTNSVSSISNQNDIISSSSVMFNYVWLPQEQRTVLSNTDFSILVNQIQYQDSNVPAGGNINSSLPFSHPVTELLWRLSPNYYSTKNLYLCYSNKNGTVGSSGWEVALRYAALNVLTGSVKVGDSTTVTSTDSKSPEVVLTSSSNNSWNTQYTITTNTHKSSHRTIYEFVPGPGIDATATPSKYFNDMFQNATGSSSSTGALIYKRDVMTNPDDTSYNLGDYVKRWVVTVYYKNFEESGAAVDSSLDYKLTVLDEDILVRDVSVPVNKWNDNRYGKGASTGDKNPCESYGTPLDIVAVFPTVSGMLVNNRYNPVETAQIKINGQDRLQQAWSGDFFNLIQTCEHTSTPSNGINVYNFALYPENDEDPSGSCNFSKISDNSLDLKFKSEIPNVTTTRNPPSLNITGNNAKLYIMARSKNYFQVTSQGVGGTKYS